MLVEKYRPKRVSEMVGNEPAERVLYGLDTAGPVKGELNEWREYYGITEIGEDERTGAKLVPELILGSA